MTSNNTTTSEQTAKREIDKEREIQAIFAKADEIKETTIAFDEQDRLTFENEMTKLIPDGEIDSPEEKYELFYKAIEKFLRENLPKGDKFKEIRSLIREEKNVFLTRGHRLDAKGLRHADSRMSYNKDMKELVTILARWEYRGGTLYELYLQLRQLNQSKGYPLK